MAYAFCLFNGVTPLGQFRLGRSASFRGNGMCFSARGLRRVPWSCHGLVEDFEYSWTVRTSGGRVAFAADAEVRAVVPERRGKSAVTQRRRWEFGRIELRRRFFVPLLRSRNLGLLDRLNSLLELTLLPMIEFLLIVMLALAGNLWVLTTFDPPPHPLVSWSLKFMTLFSFGTLALHAVSPFIVFRLPWRHLSALLFLPVYGVWKIGVLLRGRPERWVPTREQDEKPDASVCGQGQT
jgi:cellulose synthase/poly-beta-1,6-N-acetylglucosamine synthase-like glycosyltransferase